MFEAVLELQADFENAQQIAIGWLPAMLHVGFAELQAGPQQNFAQHAGIAQLHARARFALAKHPYIVAADELPLAPLETDPNRINHKPPLSFQRTPPKRSKLAEPQQA